MKGIISAIVLGVSLLLPGMAVCDGVGTHKNSNACFGDIAKILSVGGYSGDLDCTSVHVDIRKVGSINVGADTYTVYDLRYQTIPSPGLVAHGGQKIIVILNGNTYLGQYSLSPPPLHMVTIKGDSIFIDVPAKNGSEIAIGNDGPPSSAFLDQDDADFSK